MATKYWETWFWEVADKASLVAECFLKASLVSSPKLLWVLVRLRLCLQSPEKLHRWQRKEHLAQKERLAQLDGSSWVSMVRYSPHPQHTATTIHEE
jgi:hypothetical protein